MTSSDASYHEVVTGLFIGDKRIAKDKDQMQALGITHVVNATQELRNYFEDSPNFHYMKCPVVDTDLADISPFFEPTVRFIHAARANGNGVLVHCQQGVSRSAALVLAFLIVNEKLPLLKAYTKLRTVRPVVKPKPNFLKQLVAFEKRSGEVKLHVVTSPTAAKSAHASSSSSVADATIKAIERKVSTVVGPAAPPVVAPSHPSAEAVAHAATVDRADVAAAAAAAAAAEAELGVSTPAVGAQNADAAASPSHAGKKRKATEPPTDADSKNTSNNDSDAAKPAPAVAAAAAASSTASADSTEKAAKRQKADALALPLKRNVGPALPPHLAALAAASAEDD